jgi:hypothetical protein
MKASQAELTTLKTTIAAEKTAALSATFTAALDAASKDGKIDPSPAVANMSQRGWWEERAKKDGVESALTMLSAFAPVAPVKAAEGAAPPPKGTVALSELEVRISKETGTDPAKKSEYKAKRLARLAGGAQ